MMCIVKQPYRVTKHLLTSHLPNTSRRGAQDCSSWGRHGKPTGGVPICRATDCASARRPTINVTTDALTECAATSQKVNMSASMNMRWDDDRRRGERGETAPLRGGGQLCLV